MWLQIFPSPPIISHKAALETIFEFLLQSSEKKTGHMHFPHPNIKAPQNIYGMFFF